MGSQVCGNEVNTLALLEATMYHRQDTTIAVVTLPFLGGPLTGSQIAALVQRAARSGGFFAENHYVDGDALAVGQRDVRVVPVEGMPVLVLSMMYKEVKVVYRQPSGARESVASPQEIIDAVKKFAHDLAYLYGAASATNDLPDYTPKDR